MTDPRKMPVLEWIELQTDTRKVIQEIHKLIKDAELIIGEQSLIESKTLGNDLSKILWEQAENRLSTALIKIGIVKERKLWGESWREWNPEED